MTCIAIRGHVYFYLPVHDLCVCVSIYIYDICYELVKSPYPLFTAEYF